jgi:hypothetical protein
MKIRSPWLLYIAIWLSFGLFSFAWVLLMMRDINTLEERSVFPLQSAMAWLGGCFTIYFALYFVLIFSSTPHDSLIAIFFAVALLVWALLFMYVIQVRRYTNIALGMKYGIGDKLKTFFLTMAWFLAFPFTQERLNRLIETKLSADLHRS